MRDLFNFRCQFIAVWDNGSWSMVIRDITAQYYHQAEMMVEQKIRNEYKSGVLSNAKLLHLVKHDSVRLD